MVGFKDASVPDRWFRVPQPKLESVFGFVATPYTQDWEHEHADGSRLAEFFAAYDSADLTDDERFALMALCISSAHDALDTGLLTDAIWQRIHDALVANRELHTYTILYWCCADATCDDEMFTLTPRMRDVWAAAFDSEPRGT